MLGQHVRTHARTREQECSDESLDESETCLISISFVIMIRFGGLFIFFRYYNIVL